MRDECPGDRAVRGERVGRDREDLSKPGSLPAGRQRAVVVLAGCATDPPSRPPRHLSAGSDPAPPPPAGLCGGRPPGPELLAVRSPGHHARASHDRQPGRAKHLYQSACTPADQENATQANRAGQSLMRRTRLKTRKVGGSIPSLPTTSPWSGRTWTTTPTWDALDGRPRPCVSSRWRRRRRA